MAVALRDFVRRMLARAAAFLAGFRYALPMATGEVTFSIEEAQAIRDELRRVSDELDEARRTSLRTLPDGPHYTLLLEAVHVARDVGQQLPTNPTSSNAGGFALASLARWATNIQAFMILVKAGLWTEAYGIARMGSELADQLGVGGRRRAARALPRP